MSKSRFFTVISLALILVAACGLFLFAKAEGEPVNLLANPGFEADGKAGVYPKDWDVWGHSDACVTVQGDAHGGDFYAMQTRANKFQVYTFQNLTGLEKGVYTMKAWVKFTGGMESCVMGAKNFNSTGDKKEEKPPVTDVWTEFVVTGIKVTNGKASVGFWSDCFGGKSFCFDDVMFYKEP